MSFFKKLFGGSSSSEGGVKSPSPAGNKGGGIKTKTFGRYTDCNKNATQLDHWNKSLNAFKDKNYVDSFESFLRYVGDDTLNNVTVSREGDTVRFDLIQGSKRISGIGNGQDFVAETNIAEMPSHSIPVMRKLMALNYGLKYSKFALNGTALCMKFSSHAIDASPNKLYAGLKELSKKADQQDDLLLSEFSSLNEIDTDHIVPISPEHQEIKYNYLMSLIKGTKEEVAKLNKAKMSGGIAFLLLDLTYKIDYLICPQGTLTDALEKIQTQFFKKSDATTAQRNDDILAEFDRLLAQPKEKILEGLYDVNCTFGMANAAAHKTVMDMMFKEREKVAWYRDNGYPQVMEAVYGYMISYAFFNYGMVYPVTDILNIAMHILNPNYYRDMGDENKFVNADKTLNSRAIIHSINQIINRSKLDYPYVRLNTSALRFTNPSGFIDSLILELDKMDLRKK